VLRLGDLIEHEQFALRLRTAFIGQLDRRLAGAHVVETPDPMRWLQADWVALTSGVGLRRKAEQRKFVRDLANGGVTALGFAVDATFKHVPKAFVEEAERSGLPLFEVPFLTPHREIIAFVNESLLSRDMYLLRRAFSMQRYLIDAVASDSPEEELVSRLASMLESSVLLLRDDGRVVASHGRAPTDRIWQELSGLADDRQKLIVDGWTVRASPVATPGGRSNWLVISARRPTVEEHLARPVIEAAESLLGVLRLGRQAAAAEERALRSELLTQLLDDAGRLVPARDPALRARLSSAGLTGRGDVRLIVAEPLDDEAGALESVRRTVERELQRTARPHLLGVRQQRVVALVERTAGREQELEAWVGALARDGVPVNVGVGRRVDSAEQAEISFRDALFALDECRRQGLRGVVKVFEELDLAGLALAQAGDRELLPKVDAVIEPLRGRPPLEEALRAYFDANLDVSQAARALRLHHNSVRYRLAQVEKLLGVDLRSPATIANLHLALLASAALAESSKGTDEQAESDEA
jgi:PucR family transcriptional regulator, purine catabolism regulatory protein